MHDQLQDGNFVSFFFFTLAFSAQFSSLTFDSILLISVPGSLLSVWAALKLTKLQLTVGWRSVLYLLQVLDLWLSVQQPQRVLYFLLRLHELALLVRKTLQNETQTLRWKKCFINIYFIQYWGFYCLFVCCGKKWITRLRNF